MRNKIIEYKRFVWYLSNIINNNEKNIIFLCIGTTKVTGDSVGPIVGTKLKQKLKYQKNINIIGDIENNISYEIIKNIINDLNNELVIVIDSCLADKNNVGKIFIQNSGLKYAEALKKSNKYIGNASIKAIVGQNTNSSVRNYLNLKKVSEEQVQEMSQIISNGIIEAIIKKYKISTL